MAPSEEDRLVKTIDLTTGKLAIVVQSGVGKEAPKVRPGVMMQLRVVAGANHVVCREIVIFSGPLLTGR